MRKKAAVLFLSVAGLLYLRASRTGEALAVASSSKAKSELQNRAQLVEQSPAKEIKSKEVSQAHTDRQPASEDRDHELKNLLACWRGRACYADGSDAKAAHLELVEATEKLLRAMQLDHTTFAREKMSGLIDLYALADERIRRVLTEIFLQQGLTEEVLSLYEHELELSFSDGNLTLALEDLRRYNEHPDYAGRVENEVAKLILHGSSLSSVVVATQILPFLNSKNIGFFERIRDQLPEGSEKRENLTLNFREYYRLKSGG